jgi:protein arginine N-methyltransferase 7
VADDSIFLALLVSSLSPSSKVIAMFPGLRDKGATYLQAVAEANNFSMDQIQVIGKRAVYVTAHDLKHKKVNVSRCIV